MTALAPGSDVVDTQMHPWLTPTGTTIALATCCPTAQRGEATALRAVVLEALAVATHAVGGDGSPARTHARARALQDRVDALARSLRGAPPRRIASDVGRPLKAPVLHPSDKTALRRVARELARGSEAAQRLRR